MNVLVAMDSFKGSASSMECGKVVTAGIKKVFADACIHTVPLADGGEGTVAAFIHQAGGEIVEASVIGPLGERIQASYGITADEKTAIIEVASASGLPLVPEGQLNPLAATTYGVGELIEHAIGKGCKEFIIGLGGSATTDAGVGMLQALGFKFLDSNGKEIGFGGGELIKIESIDFRFINNELKDCNFQVACDVNNVLYGNSGAAFVFGPQKGATEEMVVELDKGLEHFANIALQELGINLNKISGAGAAGGLGAAFHGFLNGGLQSGIELMLDKVGVKERLENIDVIVTGEGRLDGQTTLGKVPVGVARIAKPYGIPVIAISGSITEDAATLNNQGISSYFSIVPGPLSLTEAMNPEVTLMNIEQTVEQVFRLIKQVKGE